LAGIEAGRAAISVGRAQDSTLKLRGLGETRPFVSTFAHMREELLTLVNLRGLIPISSTADRKAGPEKTRWMQTEFPPLHPGAPEARGRELGPVVRQEIRRRGATAKRNRRIAAPLFEPLTSLFVLRSLRLRPKTKTKLWVLNGNSLYQVETRVTRRERVYTKLGPRDAIRIDGVGRRIHDNGRPVAGKKPRRVSLWLTADSARIPIRLRGDTDLGTIEAVITSYRPPKTGLKLRLPRPAGRLAGTSFGARR
jgi:hypothetical protein